MSKFSYMGKEYNIEPVSNQDHIGKIIAQRQVFYELEMLEDAATFLKPLDVVLDIGANFGNHTVFFAGVCGAKVHAFEPCRILWESLFRNVAINRLKHLVTMYCMAVGPHVGRGHSVIVSKQNMGLSAFIENNNGDTPMTTVDSAGIQRVDCMKIDVEGMELDVLKGATATLNESGPVLYIEIIRKPDLDEIDSFLKDYGYKRVRRFLEITTPTYKYVKNA